MDRFDIEITMARASRQELLGPPEGEDSETIRVEAARQTQAARYAAPAARYQSPGATNAAVPKAALDATASLSPSAAATLGTEESFRSRGFPWPLPRGRKRVE